MESIQDFSTLIKLLNQKLFIMSKKLTTDTFISTNGQNRPERTEASKGELQSFNLDFNSPATSQNTLVTPWGGRQMIKELFSNILEDVAHENDTLAVEFDRQTLMLILSQNGCEGIRFSFCKFNGTTTLVAFGIEETGKLIGEDMFKEGFDPASEPKGAILGGEEGHGITIKEFKEEIRKRNEHKPDLEKITDQFFGFSFK
jgi:hypothetical protein